ncbi:hypothetical protein GOODEAATRI_014664 [Goodea atripinnis]|uniref:VLRF1 domain-containing protein n=1 Tax=Goodea atripinnis TaxID=208336 RepID=A0ABV0NLY5_9TELE
MTAFFDLPSFEQEETSIKERQRAVSEATQELEEVRQERLRAEEENARWYRIYLMWVLNSGFICSKREIELRTELVMENSEIVNALHQLGSVLEEEKHRLEQLNEQAASHSPKQIVVAEHQFSVGCVVVSQREHYKLDWHRFNLRQKMAGWPPATAEEFERKTRAGDLSSISGSESDSDEEDVDSDGTETGTTINGTDDESSAEPYLTSRLSSKVVFQNSAGEYLSVYRCMLMGKDIQDLLVTWTEHLNGASAVFVRAPSYNKTIFFGGRGSPLQKNDPRIRSLPFATRRATFREVQRVHEVLSTVQVYGVLCSLLQLPQEMVDHPEKMEGNSSRVPLSLMNEPIDSSGFTLLHVAAAAAQKAVVRLLLEAGADPACRDNKCQTPYIVAPDKDTRNVFRKYMGEKPDKYDYSKAQVPGPLTAETESKMVEKKKAQRAQRKQREKEQKEENRKQELEAEEKKRFASLTDREKLWQQRKGWQNKRPHQESASLVSSKFPTIFTGASLKCFWYLVSFVLFNRRCWSCGESLLGKIPFNYLEYSFCTPRCVQAHRKKNAPPSKS